jgi:hypothetical protein
MKTPIPLAPQAARKPLATRVLSLMAVLAAVLVTSQWTAAQTPATTPAPAPAHKPVHPHKRTSAAHPGAPPANAPQTTPAPVTPPAPVAPDWPVNDHAAEASVVWDGKGLRIEAANSSLQQIMHDVSTAIGVKIEGLNTDERVFGDFGPGEARDVLTQLLHGSSYNVLMIGDQGQGAPREIVLSARRAGDARQSANNNQANNEEDSDPDEQPQQVGVPNRPPNEPGIPPRTPQQIEMQQRMQQQRVPGQPPQANPPQN